MGNMKSAGFNDKCMESRDSFSKFLYRLHNCVNKMLGKNIKISYEEVRDNYENFRSRCSEKEAVEYIKKKEEKEKGCVGSLYGKKAKCVINIVPKSSRKNTFNINKKCFAQKL